MDGKVKKLIPGKGFGFIKGDDGAEYFFHKSGVQKPDHYDDMYEGQEVEFEVTEAEKGPRAEHVKVVG